MNEYVNIFKALGDENRLKLLKLISERNICAKGLACRLEITEAAVSQHLKILKEAGLIVGIKKGYHSLYKINSEKINDVISFINNISKIQQVVSFKCTDICSNKRCYNKKVLQEGLKMKVGFPVNKNLGLESVPFGHFGSAPQFVICDLEKGEVKSIDNGDLGHEHGACNPMKALQGAEVDCVIVGGIGMGAINGLNNLGIEVYKAVEGTIEDNLNALKDDKLEKFSAKFACNHHDCH